MVYVAHLHKASEVHDVGDFPLVTLVDLRLVRIPLPKQDTNDDI